MEAKDEKNEMHALPSGARGVRRLVADAEGSDEIQRASESRSRQTDEKDSLLVLVPLVALSAGGSVRVVVRVLRNALVAEERSREDEEVQSTAPTSDDEEGGRTRACRRTSRASTSRCRSWTRVCVIRSSL